MSSGAGRSALASASRRRLDDLRSWRRGRAPGSDPDAGAGDRQDAERGRRPRALALAGDPARRCRASSIAPPRAGTRAPAPARSTTSRPWPSPRPRSRRRPSGSLDLGTGTGEGALFLAREFPRASVRGVDLSEEMIRIAKDKVGLDPDGRVAFRVADAARLPYAEDSFDLVTQVNLPPFFAEIARVLRPGGHVIVVASIGSATPFFTPAAVLARGFRRRGIEQLESGDRRRRHLLHRSRSAEARLIALDVRARPEPLSAADQPVRGRRQSARAAAADRGGDERRRARAPGRAHRGARARLSRGPRGGGRRRDHRGDQRRRADRPGGRRARRDRGDHGRDLRRARQRLRSGARASPTTSTAPWLRSPAGTRARSTSARSTAGASSASPAAGSTRTRTGSRTRPGWSRAASSTPTRRCGRSPAGGRPPSCSRSTASAARCAATGPPSPTAAPTAAACTPPRMPSSTTGSSTWSRSARRASGAS